MSSALRASPRNTHPTSSSFQGRFFGEDMLLRHGAYPHNVMSVTFVTVNQLLKKELEATLESGRFPRTFRSIRRWVAHKAFVRTMKSIVQVCVCVLLNHK
jgi:hypothetical protein